MEQKDTGILIRKKNAEIQRFYFNQAVRLIGVQTIYRAPRPNKRYDGYGELDTFFCEPIENVGVLFEEHPTIKTMRKVGWDTELQDGEYLIHVPYDVKGLQAGGMFIVPSGLDNTEPRKFRILRMTASYIYPSEMICHIGPLFTSTYDATANNHSNSNFNLLRDKDEEDN